MLPLGIWSGVPEYLILIYSRDSNDNCEPTAVLVGCRQRKFANFLNFEPAIWASTSVFHHLNFYNCFIHNRGGCKNTL